ncbi:hypothetical protein H0H81_008256 [Sphagnurus paluster]|uniref:MYND-type domain-containing protein n=1 Tax=Sphagnurus paluster TaxID=117069 RepID=A0A9P7GR02_9AGAR|nr:hypothetical protein H0H81_008256 [Sphagnurus paluster]
MLVARASDGSLEGLKVLVAWMELNKLTARQDRLVPILYRYLEKDPPAYLEAEADRLKYQCGQAALDGVLQTFLWQASHAAIGGSLTLRYFTRLWPTICKWIQLTYSRIYPKGILFESNNYPVEGTDDHQSILTIRRLLLITHAFPVSKTMSETPGFGAMLTDLWIRLSEIRSSPVYASDVWSDLTGRLLMTMNDPDKIKAALGPLYADIPKFAIFILRNLRSLTSDVNNIRGNEYFKAIIPIAHFLSTTSLVVPGLSGALLSRNSMVEIMYTLNFTLKAPLNQPDEPGPGYLVRTCVWACLSYIEAASRFTDGFTWITQAVRSKLIQVLLKCSALPKETDVSKASPEIRRSFAYSSLASIHIAIVKTLNVLSIFSIYRSFLREVDRVMADREISLLEEGVPKEGNVWDAWMSFKRLANERLVVKRTFDKTGKYSQPCTAPNCSQRETNQFFKICSACQNSVYCSKACQTSDWKSGRHRAYCNKIRKDRAEGKPAPISEHDHKFIQFCAEFDIRRHRASLAIARREVRIDTGTTNCVVYVEYAGPPLAFVVDAPEIFPDSLYYALWETQPELRERDPPLIFLVVNVPYGKTYQMTIFGADQANSPDFWLRKVLDGVRKGEPRTTYVVRADESFSRAGPLYGLAGEEAKGVIFNSPCSMQHSDGNLIS